MTPAGTLHVESVSWSRHQCAVRWSVDDMRFATDVWYRDLDLDVLRRRTGDDYFTYLGLTIALFEVNKGFGFAPSTFTVATALRPYLTAETFQFWRNVSHNIWAQWRFEHDLPGYAGPELGHPPGDLEVAPQAIERRDRRALWFCGGGKDSLVTSDVLDRAALPYDSLAFSSSIYGSHEVQFGLLHDLATRTGAINHRYIAQNDTALGLPIAQMAPDSGVQYVLAGETPSSIFEAVPYALAHGYDLMVFGNERSANYPNLYWDAAGHAVNHQWGKSLEAEDLLNDFLRRRLCDVSYVSALQPVRDPLVFVSLNELLDRLPYVQSCNVVKRWCLECAKCLYVWISYCAWLPLESVERAFGAMDLLDRDANERWVRQLLGLADHTPFECVGQTDEAYLALRLARAKGVGGRLMALLDEAGPRDIEADLDELLRVDAGSHRLPEPLATKVVSLFERRADRARAIVAEVLGEE